MVTRYQQLEEEFNQATHKVCFSMPPVAHCNSVSNGIYWTQEQSAVPSSSAHHWASASSGLQSAILAKYNCDNSGAQGKLRRSKTWPARNGTNHYHGICFIYDFYPACYQQKASSLQRAADSHREEAAHWKTLWQDVKRENESLRSNLDTARAENHRFVQELQVRMRLSVLIDGADDSSLVCGF